MPVTGLEIFGAVASAVGLGKLVHGWIKKGVNNQDKLGPVGKGFERLLGGDPMAPLNEGKAVVFERNCIIFRVRSLICRQWGLESFVLTGNEGGFHAAESCFASGRV
jgi:hypothetical protein